MANLILKKKSDKPLKLNESVSADGLKKYIFTGEFTPCGVKNRNMRIYDEKEVLPHLAYLRDKIKKEGCILGELDHPDGRFELSLKEASHKITDLWYDTANHAVMGKLELLNTPNGKTMQAIVDAGCPLYVSSRAAGTVGNDSHVSIQQIFTYDIVATPGFEQCCLDEVNESQKAKVTSFINESLSAPKAVNKAKKYGILDEEVEVIETDETPKITESVMNYDINQITKPISEDIQVKVTPEKARELGLDQHIEQPGNATGKPADDNKPEEKHSAEDIMSIEPSYAEADDIEGIQPSFNTANESFTKEIDSSDESVDGEEYSKKIDLSERTKKKKGCSESNEINALEKIKKSVQESNRILSDKYTALLEEKMKINNIRLSILNRYPFAQTLTEENFVKFTQLIDEDKQTCQNYIINNAITSPEQINEQFLRPLVKKMNEQSNYIRLADNSDLELYNTATNEERHAIDEMAKIYVLENKQDVDEFWRLSGIRNKVQESVNNANFVDGFSRVVNQPAKNNSNDDFMFIRKVGEMM